VSLPGRKWLLTEPLLVYQPYKMLRAVPDEQPGIDFQRLSMMNADICVQTKCTERTVLDQVARTLRAILMKAGRLFSDIGPPTVRILSHKAGIALRLRGYDTAGLADQGPSVVLVEEVEPQDLMRGPIDVSLRIRTSRS
jgi:hypothetical protein